MRCKITIIICLMAVFALAGCADKYPLNGIWTSNVDGDIASIIIIENICFIKDDYEIRRGSYYFDNKSGTFSFRNSSLIRFSVDRNKMVLDNSNESYTFEKNALAQPAPKVISGIWNGTDGWIFAFVNNYIFVIDNDGDITQGTFTFKNDSGSFKCEYWYEAEFFVSGSTLEAKIDTSWGTVENISFTRAEQ